MQNPAIKTLKAIREIHNEPHQQQVHMGVGTQRWHNTGTWQFETLLPISISTTASILV